MTWLWVTPILLPNVHHWLHDRKLQILCFLNLLCQACVYMSQSDRLGNLALGMSVRSLVKKKCSLIWQFYMWPCLPTFGWNSIWSMVVVAICAQKLAGVKRAKILKQKYTWFGVLNRGIYLMNTGWKSLTMDLSLN